MRVGTSLLASTASWHPLRFRSVLILGLYRYVTGERASTALDTIMFAADPTAAQQAALHATL